MNNETLQTPYMYILYQLCKDWDMIFKTIDENDPCGKYYTILVTHKNNPKFIKKYCIVGHVKYISFFIDYLIIKKHMIDVPELQNIFNGVIPEDAEEPEQAQLIP